MLRRRAPAVCTAAVGVPAPAGLTGSASAGPSPHLSPAGAGRFPPGPPKAMRRDLGLSADRATQRIGNEFRAVAVAAALRRSLGAGFAGARLSGDAAELTVATTDAADTDTITGPAPGPWSSTTAWPNSPPARPRSTGLHCAGLRRTYLPGTSAYAPTGSSSRPAEAPPPTPSSLRPVPRAGR